MLILVQLLYPTSYFGLVLLFVVVVGCTRLNFDKCMEINTSKHSHKNTLMAIALLGKCQTPANPNVINI